MPDDVREAGTGLPVIDRSVRTFCEIGHLHNDARIWLASHVVHLRKSHGCAGGELMRRHLVLRRTCCPGSGWPAGTVCSTAGCGARLAGTAFSCTLSVEREARVIGARTHARTLATASSSVMHGARGNGWAPCG
jgi:hypothetical protein